MTISTTYLPPAQFEKYILDLVKSTWFPTEQGIFRPATLLSCIEYEAKKSKIFEAETKYILKLLQSLDNNLLKSRCFLDRLTGL